MNGKELNETKDKTPDWLFSKVTLFVAAMKPTKNEEIRGNVIKDREMNELKCVFVWAALVVRGRYINTQGQC
jgi:hypothetical protein